MSRPSVAAKLRSVLFLLPAALNLRALILIAASVLSSASAAAADDASLHWQWRVEPSSVKPGEEAELVFSASIPEGFILYSSDFVAELGPRPAKFKFDSSDVIELLGPVKAVQSQRRKDKTFGSEYSYFASHAEFRQKVRVLKNGTDITGTINGQTCQEKDGLCLLIKEPFAIRLN